MLRPVLPLILLTFVWLQNLHAQTRDLESFPNARLIPTDFNDGDSFLVEFPVDGEIQQHVVRLYFVDCPESTSSSISDRRRLLEQARYFGVTDPMLVVQYGHEATSFVEDLLEKEFTVHTAFASALGRSRKPRIYAMITLQDGRDLAELLTIHGFARAHGVSRAMPDGTSAADYSEYLDDLELVAAIYRQGIWAECNPEQLLEMRAKGREERRELTELFDEPPPPLLDINKASEDELNRLPGVGPVLAEEIVLERPYESVEDLLRVRGIGEAVLEGIRPYVYTDPERKP
ncbi:MAG: helix-hairpin-helix domain-containing protein [Verrucomicrobiales bacterium]